MIYLDNAASTPLEKEVLAVMQDSLGKHFANPSSQHAAGRLAKSQIELARRKIAQHLSCKPAEIIFTSSGTEANNLAIHAAVYDLGVKRFISSPLEHHAVLHTLEHYAKGHHIELVLLPVSAEGEINLADLQKLLAENVPTLVSLMHANNEIGTLLPFQEVASLCKAHGAFFHSDTVQTLGHYPLDLQKTPLDFMTCSAHKFHGPKGVGFLFKRENLRIQTLLHGGGQERGLRSGTENTPAILGMGVALDLAYQNLSQHQSYIQGLKNNLWQGIQALFPDAMLNGKREGLYTVLNVQFPSFSQGELLIFMLDMKGLQVSGGSACNSGANKGSHVLRACGKNPDFPSLRFSFSHHNTQTEIAETLDILKAVYLEQVQNT
jgi:cysteine desulfurase